MTAITQSCRNHLTKDSQHTGTYETRLKELMTQTPLMHRYRLCPLHKKKLSNQLTN